MNLSNLSLALAIDRTQVEAYFWQKGITDLQIKSEELKSVMGLSDGFTQGSIREDYESLLEIFLSGNWRMFS